MTDEEIRKAVECGDCLRLRDVLDMAESAIENRRDNAADYEGSIRWEEECLLTLKAIAEIKGDKALGKSPVVDEPTGV